MNAWRRGLAGVSDAVRGLGLLEEAALALSAERVTQTLHGVEAALRTCPRWRLLRRRRLGQRRGLLALLMAAYVKGIADAPKAEAVARRHLAQLAQLRGRRN